jgi:hypothetical protein
MIGPIESKSESLKSMLTSIRSALKQYSIQQIIQLFSKKVIFEAASHVRTMADRVMAQKLLCLSVWSQSQ